MFKLLFPEDRQCPWLPAHSHFMLEHQQKMCLNDITLPTPSKASRWYLQRENWCLHLLPLHETSCAYWDGNVCLQWLPWSTGKDLLLLFFFDPNGSCAPVGRVMTPLMAVERGWEQWAGSHNLPQPSGSQQDSNGLQWVLGTIIQKTLLAATSLWALHLSTDRDSEHSFQSRAWC